MLTVQPASLEWAIAHALSFGDTDVFPHAFEYEAIRHDWASLLPFLLTQDLHAWDVRAHRSLLAPKAKYGFRVVTQLDPLDFLLFASVIYEIAPTIEARRVPTQDQVVFSYRVNTDPSGQLFDPAIGYGTFLARSSEVLHDNPQFTHVAVTDIADFYPRIYLHRLENALAVTGASRDHLRAIRRFISGWNGTETFGIPVGSAPTRLLAEATISDVDEALLANGITYIRYSDDYRIFARSHTEAYRHLAKLAESLFLNHGLTLQPQKTDILTRDSFSARYLPTPEDREIESLQETFALLAAELDLSDPYETIDYNELTEEQQQMVDSLNLHQLLSDQLAGEPDLPITKFILRRLAQLGDPAPIDDVFGAIEALHPVFPDVVGYLGGLSRLPQPERSSIASRVLDLVTDSILSELPYHRTWALHLFSQSTTWDNEARFMQLLNEARDDFTRRKLILAMGRAGQRHWFQSQWRSLFAHSDWVRRALLAGASCLAPDARGHWYRSVESRLDPLEHAVIRWAANNPFA